MMWANFAVLALGNGAVQAAPDKTAPAAAAVPGSAGFSHIRSLGGIDEYRLDSNGLTVLLVPDHSAPVVTFEVTYQVGSRNEVTGTTGATHILEHMMFKGSEAFNDAKGNSIKQMLERVGGESDGGDSGLSAADKMVERIAFALQYLGHHLLLRRLLRTEPESILPSLTVNGGPVVDMAREHIAAFIRHDLFGARTPPPEAERHVQIVAELGVRIVLSFILTPSSAIPMATLEDARAFARDLIAPVHASVLSELARAAE